MLILNNYENSRGEECCGSYKAVQAYRGGGLVGMGSYSSVNLFISLLFGSFGARARDQKFTKGSS